MEKMQRSTRENLFLVPAFIVLFVGLTLLALFLISGQSSRAQILVEYQADRMASELLDTFRAQGSLDSIPSDPRIRAFGIYRADGSLVTGIGSVPASLASRWATSAFRYDSREKTLVLVRPLGMGGPAMQDMMGGMMGGFRPPAGGPWPWGVSLSFDGYQRVFPRPHTLPCGNGRRPSPDCRHCGGFSPPADEQPAHAPTGAGAGDAGTAGELRADTCARDQEPAERHPHPDRPAPQEPSGRHGRASSTRSMKKWSGSPSCRAGWGSS